MYRQDMNTTKWKIFSVSIDLFSKGNYYNVSVREIAAAAGIRSSSIYNHFESKEQILDEIFKFFLYHYYRSCPDLAELEKTMDSMSVREILWACIRNYPDEYANMMRDITTILYSLMESNSYAQDIIDLMYYEQPYKFFDAVLTKLMGQKRIVPIDVAAFVGLYSGIAFFTSIWMPANQKNTAEQYLKSLELLFSTVKEMG